jgi:hypothetical protein
MKLIRFFQVKNNVGPHWKVYTDRLQASQLCKWASRRIKYYDTQIIEVLGGVSSERVECAVPTWCLRLIAPSARNYLKMIVDLIYIEDEGS